MSEELKPCPFCGASAEIASYVFGDSPDEECWRVECTGEDTHSLDWWDDTPEEAAATWNTRQTGAQIAEAVRVCERIAREWRGTDGISCSHRLDIADVIRNRYPEYFKED